MQEVHFVTRCEDVMGFTKTRRTLYFDMHAYVSRLTPVPKNLLNLRQYNQQLTQKSTRFGRLDF